MGLDRNGYYSLRGILGYGARYNIVLSDRGRGKSYSAKLFLMAQEGTSMCLFRDVVDLKHAVSDWLEPLLENGYSAEDFEWRGDKVHNLITLYWQGAPKIWFRCLTQVNHIKQEIFPDSMCWVWLDEFIPLKKVKLRGVESEGDALRTIVKTIEHDSVRSRADKGLKPVRVLMFGNPFTWDSELLRYFRVNPFLGYGIHRLGPGVVYEMLPPLDGDSDAESWLGDDIHRNQGWCEQKSFVRPIPKGAKPFYSIRIGTEYFTVYGFEGNEWVKRTKGHCNVVKTSVFGKDRDMRFGTLDGLREDEMCLDRHPFGKRLQELRFKGWWYYPDMNTKFGWLNALDRF